MIHFSDDSLSHFQRKPEIGNPHPAPPASPAGSARAAQPLAPAANQLTRDDVTLCTLSNVNNACSRSFSTVLLATARVIVLDSLGNECFVRVLLDSASQSNFITSKCSKLLQLNVNNKPRMIVKGIGGSSKSIQGAVSFKFFSRFDRDISYEIDALVVDRVTERLPSVSVDTKALYNFDHLQLADDTYSTPGEIDMLIGASLFPHLLLSNKIKGNPSAGNSPYALSTVLGYVIIGTAPAKAEPHHSVSYCSTLDSVDRVVRKFWELEEVPTPPILSTDDKECEEFYNATTSRDQDGRYIVALPFKGDVFSLGDSFSIAERRFYYLERRFQRSPEFKLAYDDVIRDYLDKGYLSPAPQDSSDKQPSYFIPHHGVVRNDKLTSKLRIVLDASAKSSTSISLNDILYNGQNLQGNLFNIILNFRMYSIALSADIRQMFLCIGVRESDRRFQQILYRFSTTEPLVAYQFNRVCFGIKSSPFHALRTVRQLVSDEGQSENYSLASKSIETGIFMDDYVYSVDSVDEAVTTTRQMIGLMKAGQFDLVKWSSNSPSVLDSIPLSHRLSAVKEFDSTDTHKVLGLCWSPATDLFNLKISVPADICTKRTILSCVARIWDIMGFVAPVVLFAKLILKELWLSQCDWDDEPPARIIRLWTQFRQELHLLDNLKIPRHVGITRNSVVSIIGFADASEKAYGGVVYFHVNTNRRNFVHLVSAKSKVSPSSKIVSLARLELCAALILSKLMRQIIDVFSSRHRIENVYAFSDSTVALCWIHSSPHRWGTFVANRVSKIHTYLSPHNFYHVPGTDNPADCLSRGLTPAQIIDHPLWFSGPPWLTLDTAQWPTVDFNPSVVSQPPEEKLQSLVATVTDPSVILSLSKRVSSWSKLLRCVVYILRFLKLLPRRTINFITASDLDYAETRIICELQKFHFANEINNLRTSKFCSRYIQCLKPFLENDLIRVGGRLNNAQLDYDHKHPVILPRKDHIVDLIIDYYHKLNCHAGPDLLMSILRQRYWIISARNTIRHRVHKCLSCYRLRPQPTFPEMSDLRSCRVTSTIKPFIHTGTDFAGPLRVVTSRGRGIRSTKAYICLFVCLTTRSVHIELVGDLSTPSFMSAFKRFLSRRGPVGCMYSDNGTNYVGAKRSLSELHTFLRSEHFNSEFAHILSENRIKWYLNTPAASHFGGNWEANIKSLKSHLFRVIGEQILTFEELSTVLTQIEAVMNTRPLCRTLSNDPSEPLALTPAHFLTLTPLKFIPAVDIKEDRLHILSRHELLDKLVQSFWKRWRMEYLHTLQSRQKWNTPSNPITVGTVVILITENAPPLHWPLAIVEEVFPAKDGVTRVVRVKTATGTYLRPVVRICPLPN